MVCNGAGHTAKALRLLKLSVLGLQSGRFRLRPLFIGNVADQDTAHGHAISFYLVLYHQLNLMHVQFVKCLSYFCGRQ